MDNKHTEHIITLAIHFDEDRVVKLAEESAVKQMVAKVNAEVEKRTKKSGYYGESDLDEMIAKKVNDCIEEHKAEIIEKASDKLADKLSRSKVGKDLIKNINAVLVQQMESEGETNEKG